MICLSRKRATDISTLKYINLSEILGMPTKRGLYQSWPTSPFVEVTMQTVVGHSNSYELSNGFWDTVWKLIVSCWCGYHPFWNVGSCSRSVGSADWLCFMTYLSVSWLTAPAYGALICLFLTANRAEGSWCCQKHWPSSFPSLWRLCFSTMLKWVDMLCVCVCVVYVCVLKPLVRDQRLLMGHKRLLGICL